MTAVVVLREKFDQVLTYGPRSRHPMSLEQICSSLPVVLFPWKILQIPFNFNEKDFPQLCASLDTELHSLHIPYTVRQPSSFSEVL